MIEVVNLEKSFGDKKVLDGINLTVEAGERVAIIGTSGSGKSTLLSILGGFLSADEGMVLLNGENVADMNEKQLAQLRCTSLGFVFQSYRLIPTLNVRDNLFLPARLGGKSKSDCAEDLVMLSNALGISQLFDKFPNELSGGQCQRVAIARALLYRPKILILDEPTGALDSAMEKKVMDLLVRINRERGTTIVQVTHSNTVSKYGNRIVYLKDGKIV